MADKTFSEALEQAITLVTPREHSELELRQKLRKRNVEDSVIDSVILRMKELDYLSNARFCEIYADQRTRKGDGPLKITANLRRRGIDDDLIQQFVSTDEDHWTEVAREVLAKKFSVPIEDLEKSLTRNLIKQGRVFLNGRGFTHRVISRVLQFI